MARRSCYRCAHLIRATESWEMPHIWWWECAKRPRNETLWQFPFSNTKCSDHTPIKKDVRDPFADLKETP